MNEDDIDKEFAENYSHVPDDGEIAEALVLLTRWRNTANSVWRSERPNAGYDTPSSRPDISISSGVTAASPSATLSPRSSTVSRNTSFEPIYVAVKDRSRGAARRRARLGPSPNRAT